MSDKPKEVLICTVCGKPRRDFVITYTHAARATMAMINPWTWRLCAECTDNLLLALPILQNVLQHFRGYLGELSPDEAETITSRVALAIDESAGSVIVEPETT